MPIIDSALHIYTGSSRLVKFTTHGNKSITRAPRPGTREIMCNIPVVPHHDVFVNFRAGGSRSWIACKFTVRLIIATLAMSSLSERQLIGRRWLIYIRGTFWKSVDGRSFLSRGDTLRGIYSAVAFFSFFYITVVFLAENGDLGYIAVRGIFPYGYLPPELTFRWKNESKDVHAGNYRRTKRFGKYWRPRIMALWLCIRFSDIRWPRV